ncbi:glycoside hydrolase family 16 protein [Polyporus arcularius HHB13444]|uniref:Glycoside hydrolase family 16 protein n=1 Tax=Polyporus arcularius HHB13444 TaxID=1314778 RepID=A0A5C3PYR4_9APHY|nr:glycoside hydrolase family 16 protein [Polyporus arcularius HHB13444]
MRLPLPLHLPLLVFLLANAPPSEANLFARGTESLTHAANRLHHRAAKRSAGLAKDLRRAFSGMYTQELAATTGGSQQVYCVNSANAPSLSGHGNSSSSSGSSGSNGTSSSSVQTSASASSSARAPTGTSTKRSSSTTASNPSSTSSATSPWKLTKAYQGDSFFDGWDFFTGDDPTHGIVDYVDKNSAQSSNLIEVNSAGHAIMRVDTTPQVSGNRKSVRITTTFSYTGGLVLLDAVHMPTGCGTWPAFWSNGPNWPAGGEIDIVEGVNDYSNNQATIHTSHGCTIPSSSSSSLGISGNVVGGTNCAAAETGNAGCGMTATQQNTYGAGFNNNGGGVYAMQWVDSGISVWFFPRNNIPSDITSGAPLSDKWGMPMAFWPSSGCDAFKFFDSHSAIFDTTLCGDWAGNVWNSAGTPGQEQSCAARVGVSTCEDFVRNHGSSFSDAYWEVDYVKIFQ